MADVDKIIKYESGGMPEDEEVEFFQELINTGECWRLQGHYGRTAMMYINAGLCHRPEEKRKKREPAKSG